MTDISLDVLLEAVRTMLIDTVENVDQGSWDWERRVENLDQVRQKLDALIAQRKGPRDDEPRSQP